MRLIKNNKRIYFAIVFFVVWVIVFAAYNYSQGKKQLYASLNLQLKNAALTIPALLPKGFHNRAMSEADISARQDLDITLKLTDYTRRSDIIYLYTLILRDGKIYYTSSSATETEQQTGKYAVNYFEHYDDANPYVYDVFDSTEAAIHEGKDKWGNFRSILIPIKAEDGSIYVVGADLTIDHIQALLNGNLYLSLTISAFFILFLCLPFLVITSEYHSLAERLEKKVALRTSELAHSEARLNSIIEHSPVGIFHYDTQCNLLKTNKRFEEIIGAERKKLIGFNMLTRLKDTDMLAALRESLLGKVSMFEGGYTSVTGNRFMHLHANFVPLYSSSGEIEGGIGVYEDITEKQLSTEKLKKLSMAVECSPDGIIITDTNGIIEYVNPKFSLITGYTSDEVMDKKANLFRSGETANTVYEALWATILSGQEWRGELKNRKKNGDIFWSQVSIVPITNAGEITHFIGIQVDVTKERIASQQISYQATHDMLTGLINRYEFENRLTRVITETKQDNSTHVLCFFDLDQFKIINDTCGHVAGDELLRQLGILLRDNIKPRDTLARLGGDEFAILMKNCSLEQAEKKAKKMLEIIEKFQFMWEKNIFSIGASIGMTEISQRSKNTTEILIRADSACYAAKDLGRNRIHIYHSNDELLAKRDGEFRWVNEIKYALNEDRFELYAQPIVPLTDGSHKRIYEVLIRLRTKNGDMVPPGAFLPAAERYNLSLPIDRWVIDHTFTWMRKHSHQLDNLDHLAINLSGASLGSDALLQHIMQQVNDNDLPPNKIKFEITETAAISNLRDATSFIKTLREFGCQFALDDFGSGLSSFAYLKHLPVCTLKIDGIFVKDIVENPIDEAMVKSINEIGHVMGMQTIAEFVENDAIRERLKAMGVDFAQGYGIGRPEPIDNILAEILQPDCSAEVLS